jgi:putative ABC transport system permease protein
MALDTIRGHKTRAVLTVLGVIIGTGAVIGVGSILAGLAGAITNILKSFGPTTLVVFKFKIGVRTSDLTPEEIRRKPLTYENARAIQERSQWARRRWPPRLPPRRAAAARVSRSSATARAGSIG